MHAHPYSEAMRYEIVYTHYRDLVGYAWELLDSQAGRDAGDQELWLDVVLAKLAANAITLLRISPSPDPHVEGEKRLWDVPSMYALARGIVESHDALAYICVHPNSEEERLFRVKVWEQHADEQRLRISLLPGEDSSHSAELSEKVSASRDVITAHPAFSSLHKSVQKKIQDGEAPMYIDTIKDRNIANGICPLRYQAATTWLSSHVHSHPNALQQLASFTAASDEALILATRGLRYALCFLAMSVKTSRSIFRGPQPPVSDTTELIIQEWARFLLPR